MSTYGGPAAMNASQGFNYGYGESSERRQNTDPNIFKSLPTIQHPSQQLPSYHSIGRPDEKEALKPAGESANYDNLSPPSETAYEGPTDGKNAHGRNRNKVHENDHERGLMDFFYKKPDPSHSGTCSADYEPQISKTKVALATAAMAAVVFGISKYRRNKNEDRTKKFEKYTRSERRHRRHSQIPSSYYEPEDVYNDGHHRRY
ncbi:hypothetical protein GGI26_000469 [Coemansia sp. RSA 1358]|nr:hypothetical protein EDC05_001105 [Coemansia umbellata]KAJ2625669.1 hypothetical protein GGI26_000469 [Coemansia sp. RSA 1358]